MVTGAISTFMSRPPVCSCLKNKKYYHCEVWKISTSMHIITHTQQGITIQSVQSIQSFLALMEDIRCPVLCSSLKILGWNQLSVDHSFCSKGKPLAGGSGALKHEQACTDSWLWIQVNMATTAQIHAHHQGVSFICQTLPLLLSFPPLFQLTWLPLLFTQGGAWSRKGALGTARNRKVGSSKWLWFVSPSLSSFLSPASYSSAPKPENTSVIYWSTGTNM